MIMQIIIDPPHNKTNKMACTPSIRVFAVRSMGSYGPKLSSCGQRRLIRLGGSQADLYLRLAHMPFSWFLSCAGSVLIFRLKRCKSNFDLTDKREGKNTKQK